MSLKWNLGKENHFFEVNLSEINFKITIFFDIPVDFFSRQKHIRDRAFRDRAFQDSCIWGYKLLSILEMKQKQTIDMTRQTQQDFKIIDYFYVPSLLFVQSKSKKIYINLPN